MILNPILTETELTVACQALVDTGQLDRVIDYFVREKWNSARYEAKNERELRNNQLILQNYEELGKKITNSATTAKKPTLTF